MNISKISCFNKKRKLIIIIIATYTVNDEVSKTNLRQHCDQEVEQHRCWADHSLKSGIFARKVIIC